MTPAETRRRQEKQHQLPLGPNVPNVQGAGEEEVSKSGLVLQGERLLQQNDQRARLSSLKYTRSITLG